MNSPLKKNISLLHQYAGILRRDYLVKRVGIFGSVAKGTSTQKSDIDILVEFTEPVGFFRFLSVEHFLAKILKRKVDLATKKALKPIIRKQILKEVVYA